MTRAPRAWHDNLLTKCITHGDVSDPLRLTVKGIIVPHRQSTQRSSPCVGRQQPSPTSRLTVASTAAYLLVNQNLSLTGRGKGQYHRLPPITCAALRLWGLKHRDLLVLFSSSVGTQTKPCHCLTTSKTLLAPTLLKP